MAVGVIVLGYFTPGVSVLVDLHGLFVQIWNLLPDDFLGIEDENLGALVLMLVAISLVLRMLASFVQRWLAFGRANHSPSVTSSTESAQTMLVQRVSHRLRTRSQQLRRTAQILMTLIVVLLVFGFLMFQGAESAALRLYGSFEGPLRAQADSLRYRIDSLGKTANTGA